jgi:hypothetical protein
MTIKEMDNLRTLYPMLSDEEIFRNSAQGREQVAILRLTHPHEKLEEPVIVSD